MTAYPSAFLGFLNQAWLPYYFPAMVCAMALGVILARATRRALLFTIQMLVLFVVLVASSAVAASLASPELARGLSQLAILVLGMTLIRQGGLALFRLVVPKLGMRPPRILEELLILLAYVIWLLLRLTAGGLDLGSLVASTAVITAVLAFAMQDTLGNILAGLALQLDHSVHIGDWIQIEEVGGRVVEVQWRHTAVRTLFGELLLIPNSQLMKSRVMLTGGPSAPLRLRMVRFYCDFDLPSSLVISHVQQALAQADLPGISNNPAPTCVITNFTDGVLEYGVRYWLADPESPGISDSLIRQHLHAIFRRLGWRMAAPGREVRFSRVPASESDAAKEQHDRAAVLADLPLFSALTDSERTHLAARLALKPYAPGATIARQGQVGDSLFILVQGQVDVWLEENGQRNLLAVLDPVQVMGEMSLLTGEPRSATLCARGDVECYALSKEDFQVVLQSRPELADSFAQLLAKRSQQRSQLQEKMQQPQAAQKQDAILTRIRSLFGLGR